MKIKKWKTRRVAGHTDAGKYYKFHTESLFLLYFQWMGVVCLRFFWNLIITILAIRIETESLTQIYLESHWSGLSPVKFMKDPHSGVRDLKRNRWITTTRIQILQLKSVETIEVYKYHFTVSQWSQIGYLTFCTHWGGILMHTMKDALVY